MASLVRPVAIILVWLCSLASARAEKRQEQDAVLRFGGFLGGGLADWVGEDADGSTPGIRRIAKPIFRGALIASVDLSGLLGLDVEPLRLAVQPELVYAMKGSRLERDGEYRGASTNMTYLQAGLLVRVDYSVAEKFTPYVILGPELGVLYSVEFENGLGDTIDNKDDYESTDLGLVVGLGAMYELPRHGALGLELRADLGLVSIDGQGDGDEIRNAALTLLLAYLY